MTLQETTSATPIFFILFPGYSPSAQIEAYAKACSKTAANGKLALISLGQVLATSQASFVLDDSPAMSCYTGWQQDGLNLLHNCCAAIASAQGQEAPAEKALDTFIQNGGWIFLDNLHLMQARRAWCGLPALQLVPGLGGWCCTPCHVPTSPHTLSHPTGLDPHAGAQAGGCGGARAPRLPLLLFGGAHCGGAACQDCAGVHPAELHQGLQ